MRTDGRRLYQPTLRSFCRWIGKKKISLHRLKPHHVEQFWEHEHKRGIRKVTTDNYRLWLHKWLYWLSMRGDISFDVTPPLYHHLFVPLPVIAQTFLGINPSRLLEKKVRYFHAWLGRQSLTLEALEPKHIDSFLCRPHAGEIGKSARHALFKNLKPYFLWLHDNGLLSFRVQRPAPKDKGLDKHALAFLESLATVKKESTCKTYCSTLRRFYLWLRSEKITLKSIERRHTAQWLSFLMDCGISTGARKNRIIHLRFYFEWLFENGLIDAYPDDLIWPSDIPKTPQYLPRPYPFDADREICRRLAADPSLYSQALLLMRRTGVRIGELARLDPHCLVNDMRGYAFLKVPLGKLDNERLVPLDSNTRKVLERLRAKCSASDIYLLEPSLKRHRVMAELRNHLKIITKDIDIPGPIVTHRLRHTYATELLNAGMSLAAIMKLLGHKSIAMTARYADITLHSVIDQYRNAMLNISSKYETANAHGQARGIHSHPDRLLHDTISWLRLNRDDFTANPKKIDSLIKRIYRLEQEISNLEKLT